MCLELWCWFYGTRVPNYKYGINLLTKITNIIFCVASWAFTMCPQPTWLALNPSFTPLIVGVVFGAKNATSVILVCGLGMHGSIFWHYSTTWRNRWFRIRRGRFLAVWRSSRRVCYSLPTTSFSTSFSSASSSLRHRLNWFLKLLFVRRSSQ